MEESESKQNRGAGPRVREGAANRAKNHTVILNPHVTGGVRSRIGGDLRDSASGRVGGLEAPTENSDPSWETPRVSSDLAVRKEPAARNPFAEMEVVEGEADSGSSFSPQASASEPEQGPTAAAEPFEAPVPQAVESSPERDSWDPLGLFDDAVAEEPAPKGKLLAVDAAPRDFKPDPLPEFVHVAEEHMLTESEIKAEEIYWKACTQLVGFLVSFDFEPTGSYLELRTGRLIVTSQMEGSGNCLVLPHESVSPSHAVMRVATGGSIQVLDQLSESGTRIRKFDSGEEVLLSGEKAVLSHGDVVSFGDRSFHVCLVMGHSAQE